jgi:O-antigen/teichoic acid export membrane protein
VLGGGLWQVVSATLPQLYTLVVSVVAARYLGADGLGRQSFISFVETTAIALLSAGLPIGLMRAVGEAIGREEQTSVRPLVAWAWRLELLGAGAGAAVLAGAALAGAEPQAAWLFAAVAAVGGILHTVPSALLIGLQRWRQASIAGLATGGIGTVLTIVVLAAGAGITGMFAVEAAMSLVGLVWTSALARRAERRLERGPADIGPLKRQTARFAAIASVAVVLNVIVWRRSEFIFLDHYSTDAEIAYYSVAFALITAVVRLPGTVGTVLSPAVATLFGAGAFDRIRSGFARALRLAIMATLPLLALTIALGPAALTEVWGPEFEAARDPLVVMACASIVVPMSILSVAVLIGLGNLRGQLLIDAAAAAVNIVLAFALIPHHGALGAAIANSGAQIVSGVAALAYASRLVGGVHWRPFWLLPAALVSAATGIVAWAVLSAVGGMAGLILGTLAGVVVFAGLGMLVRIVPADDAQWLAGDAGDRLGGLVGTLAARFGRRA